MEATPRAEAHHRSRSRSASRVVWIDGRCSVCRQARQWIMRRDRWNLLRFRDVHDAPETELPRPFTEMTARLHLVGPEGHVATGYEAILKILGILPGWRMVATIAGRPPLSWIGPPLYRLIAPHRQTIGRLLGRIARRPHDKLPRGLLDCDAEHGCTPTSGQRSGSSPTAR